MNNMRTHTISKHDLQITRYKAKYGPFEIIEPQIFHRCHICGKVVLMDRDILGGHIKGAHKMKERKYMEKYMTYRNNQNRQAPVKKKPTIRSKRLMNNSTLILKEESTPESRKPTSPIFDFLDYEYSCNLEHCELCERAEAVVKLEPLEKSILEDLDIWDSENFDVKSDDFDENSLLSSPGLTFSPKNLDGVNLLPEDFTNDNFLPIRCFNTPLSEIDLDSIISSESSRTLFQAVSSVPGGLGKGKGNVAQIRDKLLGESGLLADVSNESLLDSSLDSLTDSSGQDGVEINSFLSKQDEKFLSEISYSEIMEDLLTDLD